MGSVMSDIECPNCKYKNATSDLYYKTGEEYIFCERCGYTSNYTMDEKDRKSKKLLKNCKFEEKESGGFGSWKVLFKGGGTLGSFKTKKQIKEFEENFKKGFENQEGKIADEVTYTFKKNGKWYIKDLVNKKEYLFIKKEIIDNL